MAFKVAGSMAFREAARRAKPVLLEPIMAVEVVTPEEFMGDVIGDLNRRRGRIEGMEPRGNAQVIRAYVPLAEMFGYATDLRSADAGPGHLHDAVRALRGGPLGACPRRSSSTGRHPRAAPAPGEAQPEAANSSYIFAVAPRGARYAGPGVCRQPLRPRPYNDFKERETLSKAEIRAR